MLSSQACRAKGPTIQLTTRGNEVPDSLLGELRPADRGGSLAEQLEQDGYLLLRGLHDPKEVMAARHEVFNRLAEVGEIGAPAEDGIATGTSRRAELHSDLGKFWKSVSEGPALRAVVFGPRVTSAMTDLFDAPVSPFSFTWLRAMAPGRASPPHVDHPYMNRGTDRLVTCWTPLGPVPRDEGSLYILERSHCWVELREAFEGHDVDRNPSRPGHITENPVEMARTHGARLLTTDFLPGDSLVFGMFTAHASFDNGSAAGRVRISCDTRFQPAAEPMDPRFTGKNPSAHRGLGYGCLSAARPLVAEEILR